METTELAAYKEALRKLANAELELVAAQKAFQEAMKTFNDALLKE